MLSATLFPKKSSRVLTVPTFYEVTHSICSFLLVVQQGRVVHVHTFSQLGHTLESKLATGPREVIPSQALALSPRPTTVLVHTLICHVIGGVLNGCTQPVCRPEKSRGGADKDIIMRMQHRSDVLQYAPFFKLSI